MIGDVDVAAVSAGYMHVIAKGSDNSIYQNPFFDGV